MRFEQYPEIRDHRRLPPGSTRLHRRPETEDRSRADRRGASLNRRRVAPGTTNGFPTAVPVDQQTSPIRWWATPSAVDRPRSSAAVVSVHRPFLLAERGRLEPVPLRAVRPATLVGVAQATLQVESERSRKL